MNPVQRASFKMSFYTHSDGSFHNWQWDLDRKWHEKSFDTCFYNWTWSCYHNLILVTGMVWL